MNKYIEAIKNNDKFLINFFSIYNDFFKKEKDKKGMIKAHDILKLDPMMLYKENFKINRLDSSSSTKYTIERLNMFEYQTGLNIKSFFIEISKKNNEVLLNSISIKNKLDKDMTIEYSINIEEKETNISIILYCNLNNVETILSINTSGIKIYSLDNKNEKNDNYEKNKEFLYKLKDIAEINKELVLDYLLLGKNISKEEFDLFYLENDIFIDEKKNLFRINLKNNFSIKNKTNLKI